jgi:hypothetical protein
MRTFLSPTCLCEYCNSCAPEEESENCQRLLKYAIVAVTGLADLKFYEDAILEQYAQNPCIAIAAESIGKIALQYRKKVIEKVLLRLLENADYETSDTLISVFERELDANMKNWFFNYLEQVRSIIKPAISVLPIFQLNHLSQPAGFANPTSGRLSPAFSHNN